jgi:hypothetical protein
MATDQHRHSPRFVHIDDVPAREAVAQMHGARRVGVHLQVLEWNSARFVAHTRYDPGLVLARHAHKSDALIYILDGEVQIGDRRCPAGTLIVLEKDDFFGPLTAGPEGCTFLESYAGDVASVHEDEESYQQLLSSQGIVSIPIDMHAK